MNDDKNDLSFTNCSSHSRPAGFISMHCLERKGKCLKMFLMSEMFVFAVFDTVTMKVGLKVSWGLVNHLSQAVRK